MDRGLFYQLGGVTPARFDELAQEVLLAESLGIGLAWCLPATDADGRFAESAPGIWLAALAAQTRRIRLGIGLAGVWPPLSAPVREAEQAATLDRAAGGRLEVALLPDVGDDADEGLRMLCEMWAPGTFSWASERFAVPPIDVVPKPAQRPHPPVWLAGWNAEHAQAAGRIGLAFLDVSGGGSERWESHRALRAEARGAQARVAGSADEGERSRRNGESAPAFAVAVERVGSGAWLEELAALGIDGVVVRAGPLDGGHDEACDRIRALAAA